MQVVWLALLMIEVCVCGGCAEYKSTSMRCQGKAVCKLSLHLRSVRSEDSRKINRSVAVATPVGGIGLGPASCARPT